VQNRCNTLASDPRQAGMIHALTGNNRERGAVLLGIALFFVLTLGLGALLPRISLAGRPSIGALWLGGYALLTGIVFFAHVILRVPMVILVWLLVVFATLALIRWLRAGEPGWRPLVMHPCVVLSVFAALAILAAGGIGYQPYTVDEFTNWLGASRLIFFEGGYEPVRDTIYLGGYTPGWRMLLTVPWFYTGRFDPGLSAAASLMLHIAVAGLFFDLVRAAMDGRLKGAGRPGEIVAWTAILLYLGAQVTGALWPYTLLIEQPQIYAFAAMAMLLFAIDEAGAPRREIATLFGLTMLLAYLLKTAAVLFAPGAGLALLLVLYRRGNETRAEKIKDLAFAFVPVLAAMIAWSVLKPASESCFSSPGMTLTAEAFERARAYDWGDLFYRFTAGIGAYLASYKWPLSIVAAVGIGAAVITRRYAMPLALGVFVLLYFGALYWFHLTCFGAYNFETLASIERFTRVALQPIQAAGLLALGVVAIRVMPKPLLDDLLGRRFVLGALAAVGTALIIWQSLLLQRNVEDMTTRRYQNVDPRIAEVARAAAFVEGHARYRNAPPLIQFVSQGTDADILGYATYYAIGDGGGEAATVFRTAPTVSWSLGDSANVWQHATGADELQASFREADIIWPVRTEPWLDELLRALAANGDCGEPMTHNILIKDDDGKLVCRAKP